MPAQNSKLVEQAKQKLVANQPITADIQRPFQSSTHYYLSAWRVDKLPPFNIWISELMRRDQQVAFGLDIRNGVLMAADAVVASQDEEMAAFVTEQWKRIWNSSGHKILETKLFGYMGYEVMYQYEPDGKIGFKRLKDLHPSMVRPLTGGNEVKGMRVRPTGSFGWAYQLQGQEPEVKRDPYVLMAPKGLWTTFQSRFENPFGEPLLERSYAAWWEKWMEHGAKRACQLRMVKDAWIGDRFWYPANQAVTNPDGSKVSWRDIAREASENRLSGAAMCLPMLYDQNGKELVKYEPPVAIQGEAQQFKWIEALDIEIWKGEGVPPEVIQAAGTGSGFSGRSIPFVAFVAGVLKELAELVECIDRMILRPICWLNFARKPDYEIKVIEIDQLVQKLMGGAGTAMGGGGMGQGIPPQMLAGMAGALGQPNIAPRQFAEDVSLAESQKRLPTVLEIARRAGVSNLAAKRARILTAAAQLSEEGVIPASRLLRAAGIKADTAPVHRRLDRLQQLLPVGVPMAYRFDDTDYLEKSDKGTDYSPSEDDDDNTDYDEEDGDLMDELDDEEGDPDEASDYDEEEEDMLDDESEDDWEDDGDEEDGDQIDMDGDLDDEE